MVSSTTQAKVESDNSRLEGSVRTMIDEIDKSIIRPIAKKGLNCSIKCYDNTNDVSSEQLQHCIQLCEQPHQKANAIVRQEIGQYQNRLERAIHECGDKARDSMKIGFEQDMKLVSKFENIYANCIHTTVNEYITKLKPIKERIVEQLK